MLNARQVWRFCVVALIACIVALVFVINVAAQTSPHPHMSSPDHWYPLSCCSQRDCAPVATDAIRLSERGFVMPTGELVPYSDPRIKFVPPQHDDGETFHWCKHLTGPNKDKTICLFIPQPGS